MSFLVASGSPLSALFHYSVKRKQMTVKITIPLFVWLCIVAPFIREYHSLKRVHSLVSVRSETKTRRKKLRDTKAIFQCQKREDYLS